MADTVVKPKTKVKTRTERPRMHKVILINDDYTPREFVVTVLKAEFRMPEGAAERVMLTAHQRGACVVAVMTSDASPGRSTSLHGDPPCCTSPGPVIVTCGGTTGGS